MDWIGFSARFKFQLTVCDPKLGVPLDVAKRTVHYFWGLMKQAGFSPQFMANGSLGFVFCVYL
jgi:hypothetical protein